MTALATAVGYAVVVAVPTDVIDNPWFSREIPPTWWAWPSLGVTAVLVGLLAATYVRTPEEGSGSAAPVDTGETADRPAEVRGYAGAFLSFFAVGCPVCNKLVLIALGYSGALTWFQPLQPVLQVLGIALLLWALRRRWSTSRSCPVPVSSLSA
ncbi:MAG: hypothetical protein IE926_01270 [Micrococcales bacterium]|nr:hypothetical protein [Micrococcales bacterium]